MRIAFMIVVATLASPSWLGAQTVARRDPEAVARRFVDGQLSGAAFRRRRCVSAKAGDCPGGVSIVRRYTLREQLRTSDMARYTVEFQVVGTVGVSEAAPFFMPNAWADSGEVVVERHRGRWVARSSGSGNGEAVRTTATVARGYFDLDATDRRLLDSALAAPRRP